MPQRDLVGDQPVPVFFERPPTGKAQPSAGSRRGQQIAESGNRVGEEHNAKARDDQVEAVGLETDYKISGIDVPCGSREARVLDEIAPADDEMICRKTSSSVFISTNIDCVLRNLGVRSLIIAGIMTDQCVESAVRDACDLGYLVTLVTDACTTHSAERHEQSLIGIRGYCRQRGTDELVAEVAALTRSS
jgi:nicotinamidase-related amidase